MSNPTPPRFDEINEITGFATGARFGTERQVRDYFRVSTFEGMTDDCHECVFDQGILDGFAEEVIEHRWHMESGK